MNIFQYDDYQLFLQDWLKSQSDSWGLISRMAQACGCQRSYLSRVLNSHVHLTLDQAFGLSRFLKQGSEERKFFMKLVEWARAGEESYREHLQKEIEELRKEQEDLGQRLQKESLASEIHTLYYSAWHWSAIHILTSVPEYQSVKRISERLYLPPMIVVRCLEVLREHGLVKKTGSRWEFASGDVFLPKSSPMVLMHHSNWRQRAVMDSQNLDQDGVHFTTVQSLSRKDFRRLRAMVLNWVEEYSEVANPSDPEELFSFSCDFFRV